MSAAVSALLAAVGGYLVGSIPAGYLVGRAKGVDLFQHGSKNTGATNAGRVLGLWWGVLVFVLDFAKGAAPTALAWLLPGDGLYPDALPVVAGISAFLGNLFPVYLGFKGGKGVATGCGVAAVLAPLHTLAILAAWGLVLAATRYMSLASLSAVLLLIFLRLLVWPSGPFDERHLVVTLFCLIGSTLVIVRHIPNIRRLILGTENRLWGR
jgi:acyl-phosphate glycerol 3-phosphate acyltransferase